MGSPLWGPGGRRRELAVTYAWGPLTVSTSTESQIERIRRHCFEQKWEIVAEVGGSRFPELAELARRVAESQAQYLVLTREAEADLRRRVPDLWADLQARFQQRDVVVVLV
jgi:hypothetical protein